MNPNCRTERQIRKWIRRLRCGGRTVPADASGKITYLNDRNYRLKKMSRNPLERIFRNSKLKWMKCRTVFTRKNPVAAPV